MQIWLYVDRLQAYSLNNSLRWKIISLGPIRWNVSPTGDFRL